MSNTPHSRPALLRMSASGLWLAALVMSGATAAIAFPLMKQLGPTLPGFTAYPGEHHRIAAGMVMARVFVACDVLQIVAAVLVLVAGLWSSRRPVPTGLVTRLGWVAIGLAIVLLVGKLAMLDPLMRAELGAFWSAAAAGSLIDAELHRQRFDALHPRASMVMYATAALVLGAIVAWFVGSESRRSAER